MSLLTREQILNADDIKRQTVPVPEWGGEVIVTTMSGRQRDAFEMEVYRTNGEDKADNLENIRAKLFAMTMIDEHGKPLFTTADIPALGEKGAKALSRVFDVATKLNHITEKDVQELAGNSAGGPSGEHGSDSPAA